MSYLGYPRLHFSGGFLADPSTINNTPNNYSNDNPDTNQLELYWNPNGTGIFDLQECTVTKVVYAPGKETTDPSVDPIIGQSVKAVYSKAAPKLVDLDPDQQNVSEIWGLSLQVGGTSANPQSIKNFVRGDYVEGSFNAIWGQALNGPRSSASGSGVYQSQLKNLAWDINSAPISPYLSALNTSSSEQLSVNFVVNSHNNSPVQYAFTTETFKALAGSPYNIPADIIAKLEPMSQYFQNLDSTTGVPKNRGFVPTESYVNQQFLVLLGQQDANTYGSKIRQGTIQPYDPGNIATKFPFGLVTGTIGPQQEQAPAPIYYTPSRTMAPLPNGMCYFAPFNAYDVDGQSVVTLNLGNALNTNAPGYDVATDALGDLSLVYFNQGTPAVIELSNAVTFAKLPNNMDQVLKNSAGIIDLSVDNTLLPKDISLSEANQAVLSMPLGLIGELNGTKTILLAENIFGYNLRADQFVYRMNPGTPSSASQPQGETANVNFYLTCFGKPAAGVELTTYKLDQTSAISYTTGTLGTSGTAGIKNLSIPTEALALNSYTNESATITTDAMGMAQLALACTDPGDPRASQNVDGQVYFIRYGFVDTTIQSSYTQDVNDLVSVQVYGKAKIPAKPTWDNCIRFFLPQYAKLYPIMGRFELNNYASVVENRAAIKMVLSKPMADALRMPVIRDMSILRTNAVIDWINNGTPKE